ncbi:DUF6541 family protein [Microbacterium sp. ASV81]|uniref:Uncharacterized protein n=1 Tax=Microbacterium capsulatum TaxID=3041921 RepID=A0ABU0XKP2_9MICO|nr:DUF6541 family protein [Microbacterium sp. ASV81]MDQ4215392.1 hypothetical protein [Microbacterium sp. ASV81]
MTDATWLDLVLPLLAATALLLVPGVVATAALRVGLVARVAFAGVSGVVSIGVAGVLAALVGLPFAPWQPLLPAAVILGVSMLLRRRRPRTDLLPRERVRWWWLVAVGIASTAVVVLVAFAHVPGPDRISQTYDNVFHLSAIAHILQTGDGSSLALRTMIETTRTFSYYPAAWHDLVALTVQLSGAPIPVAVNAAWVAVCAVAWIPGAAWLAQLVARSSDGGIVALIAMPLAACSGAMPFALLGWGSLYPTFVATAALPVAVGIPFAAWIHRRDRPRDAGTIIALVLAFGTACAAVALGQPRVLATLAVILVPFFGAVAAVAFLRAWRAGGRSRRRAVVAVATGSGVLVAAVVVGFLYAVVRLGLFSRPLESRLGGGQARATQSVADGLIQVLTQTWLTGIGTATAPALLVAVATAVGLFALARTPGSRWIVVSFLALAVLFALAAGSDAVVTKLLTALWYKDRYRLSSGLPVLGVALATVGILFLARLIGRRAVRWRPAIAAVLAVATTATAVLALGATSAATGFVFRLPSVHAGDAVVSRTEAAFFARSSGIIPAGERVLGDPWDGSALSAVFGGREPVFAHVNGQFDADRLVLAYNLDEIGSNPAVCRALDALRVRFVLYDPHQLDGGDPSGNHFPAVHRAVDHGLFERVSRAGDTVLYRIDQCGPLAAR